MSKHSIRSLVPEMQIDLARCNKWNVAFGNKTNTPEKIKELIDGVVFETIKACIEKLDDKESIEKLKSFIQK